MTGEKCFVLTVDEHKEMLSLMNEALTGICKLPLDNENHVENAASALQLAVLKMEEARPARMSPSPQRQTSPKASHRRDDGYGMDR